MANINLLPWREELRRERNQVTIVICAVMAVIAGLIVFSGKLYVDSLIEHQNARNAFLQSEINGLSKVIKEIEDIKEKRDALRSKMDVIQALQQNRAQIVHVFDDLVTKLPNGVSYENVSKSGPKVKIEGKAQSNNRVSAFMRSLDESQWFDGATLTVVDVEAQDGVSVSEFNVEVNEQSQTQDDGVENIR